MDIPAWRGQLSGALKRTPVSIADVLEIQAALQGILRSVPGGPVPLAAFNDLYLKITARIRQEYLAGGFLDRDFIEVLDVRFARRYFDALLAWERAGGQAPACWTMLFEKGPSGDAAGMQGMLAGVSNHVNYDLAQALVATFAERGLDPGAGEAGLSRQHQDYDKINDIFFSEIPRLRRGAYFASWQAILDAAAGPLDNDIDDIAIMAARALAWRESLVLWELRPVPAQYDEHVRNLDDIATRLCRVIFLPGAAGLVI